MLMATPTFLNVRRRRFIALLAALGLMVGQVLLSQHIHAEDLPERSCVVCLHNDHTPHVAAPFELPAEITAVFWSIDVAFEPAAAKPVLLFLARAPPSS